MNSKEKVSKQLQEFAKFYLANIAFCQLITRYAKEKKSSSPTVWHNPLVKSRSNLHQ
jgi:hypothetical protein